MNKQTIYGFILDESARTKSKLDTAEVYNQGVGVLLGEPANYLVKKAYLKDLRAERLQDSSKKSPKGDLEIVYDANRVADDILSVLTDEQQHQLFDIAELIYTQNKQTDDELETILTSDQRYTGYVAESLNHSTEYIDANLLLTNNKLVAYKFANWVEFEYLSGNVNYKLHLWISNHAFAEQYPYVTITSVIAPYEVKKLTDPTVMLNLGSLDVLANSANYVFSRTNLETLTRDQNGVYTFPTKYILDARTTITIYFALAYCGAHTPSSLDCRRAIRSFLEENSNRDPLELKAMFPDIYINNRFYLVPLYDLYTPRAGKDYYTDIWNIKTLHEHAETIFTDYDQTTLDTQLELLTNAQNNMLALAMPDSNNEDYTSILAQHPTYQNYATSEAGFKYLDAATQEFAADLYTAMAIAVGITTSDKFALTEEANRKYLVFANGVSEYLLMLRESYTKLINPE